MDILLYGVVPPWKPYLSVSTAVPPHLFCCNLLPYSSCKSEKAGAADLKWLISPSTKIYRHKSDWKIRPQHSKKKNKCLFICIFINNKWSTATVGRCYYSITKMQTVLYSLNEVGVKYSKKHIEWLLPTCSWKHFLQSRASSAELPYSYGNRLRKLNGNVLIYYLSTKIRG